MTPADLAALRALRELPNVGPAVARDLLRLGIRRPGQLKGRDPLRLYRTLCRRDGVRHDPCVIDVFMALTDHASGAPAKPWWHFTKKRKAMVASTSEKGRNA